MMYNILQSFNMACVAIGAHWALTGETSLGLGLVVLSGTAMYLEQTGQGLTK